MHPIVAKIMTLLETAQDKEVYLPDTIYNEFGEKCKQLLRRHFEDTKKDRGFRIRASNIGRPLCQLQMEKAGEKKEPHRASYANKMSAIYGDMIEALAVSLMKAADVEILAEQKKVSLEIGGIELEGTFDLDINMGDESGIYDLKSCSNWAFEHKFGPNCSFKTVMEDDNFGYTEQGFLYSQAEQRPFAGWIAINKETGQWNVITTPLTGGYLQQEVLEKVNSKIRMLTSAAPFERQFEPVIETFRKKKTGNEYLAHACEWCNFKGKCWGKLTYSPVPASEAASPPWRFYTKLEENEDKKL